MAAAASLGPRGSPLAARPPGAAPLGAAHLPAPAGSIYPPTPLVWLLTGLYIEKIRHFCALN